MYLTGLIGGSVSTARKRAEIFNAQAEPDLATVATMRIVMRIRATSLPVVCCAALVFAAAAYPALAVERALVGVPIFSPAQEILRKFGNPNFILTSGQTFAGAAASTATTAPSAGLGQLPPLAPPGQAMPEFGGGARSFGGPTASSDTSSVDASAASPGEVTYVYQKSNGITYQFLLSPTGKVIQITALGYSPAGARTSRGISLNSTYTQVLAKYGNPESIEPTGLVTTLRYTRRAHVAFQLVANKVVGIIVAAIQ